MQNAIMEVFPFLSVDDISLVSANPLVRRKLQSADVLEVVYSLAVDVVKADYENSAVAFYSIRDALELVTHNGDLSAYLQHYAQADNVTAMLAATTNAVSVVSVVTVDSDSQGSSAETASTLDKRVALVFAVALFVVIATIVWCCVKHPRQLPGLPYSELDSESTHHSVHPTANPFVQRRADFEQVQGTDPDSEEVEIELSSNPMRADPDMKV